MPGQLAHVARQDRATWWQSVLTLLLVLLALVLVPLAHWWALPLLVWAYTRAMPRWVPVWFQWGLVIFLSGHLAVVSEWAWGASLALVATTVAGVYWERTQQQFLLQVLQETSVAAAWFLLAFWSENPIWWEANIIIFLAVVGGLVYRQGK
jgi:hypothetical protein